jgi:hypothetical protein
VLSSLGILGGGGSKTKKQIKKPFTPLHVNKHVIKRRRKCALKNFFGRKRTDLTKALREL